MRIARLLGVEQGVIDSNDLALMQILNEPQEVVDAIFRYYEQRSFTPSAEELERLLEL